MPFARGSARVPRIIDQRHPEGLISRLPPAGQSSNAVRFRRPVRRGRNESGLSWLRFLPLPYGSTPWERDNPGMSHERPIDSRSGWSSAIPHMESCASHGTKCRMTPCGQRHRPVEATPEQDAQYPADNDQCTLRKTRAGSRDKGPHPPYEFLNPLHQGMFPMMMNPALAPNIKPVGHRMQAQSNPPGTLLLAFRRPGQVSIENIVARRHPHFSDE